MQVLIDMSMQEAVDRAYAGVIAQGGPSMESATECMYRGPNGTKCAIGHLIADKDYVPEMETASVAKLHRKYTVSLDDEFVRFLHELQKCHDRAALRSYTKVDFLREFRSNVDQLCRLLGLTSPVDIVTRS